MFISRMTNMQLFLQMLHIEGLNINYTDLATIFWQKGGLLESSL